MPGDLLCYAACVRLPPKHVTLEACSTLFHGGTDTLIQRVWR